METMSNEQKAFELSSMRKYGFTVEESNAAYNAALEMAEWKDEQEIEFLQSLIFQPSRQNIFEMINERAKQLKG